MDSRPKNDDSKEKKEAWIRMKYIDLKFIDKNIEC